jgi:hypothetical protein
MAITILEASFDKARDRQGTTRGAHGKSKIQLKLPRALRLKPLHTNAFKRTAIPASALNTSQLKNTQSGGKP